MTEPTGRDTAREASDLLQSYRLRGTSLYVVGSFDTGVTVLSQQTRALNFAWAAIESGLFDAAADSGGATTGNAGPPSAAGETSPRVAIIGCGFAGLTLAAGLLKKGARASFTLFEQRDTLLPLQEGSDTRWLHPRIYDWPSQGSDASVAMLPVMNWAAGRASDVVVQVLEEWADVLRESTKREPVAGRLELFCNARHLQIDGRVGGGQLRVEWVGEARNPIDGRAPSDREPSAVGQAAVFDVVILTIGFGLERDDAVSYWRNETLGQPSLDEPRATFLVSGQGDGAMIDLLRLRISQFRQDRILSELFSARPTLLAEFKRLQGDYEPGSLRSGLFAALEALETGRATADEFAAARSTLQRRLRRDTDVILHLKVKKVDELFDPGTARLSFQNKLLVYFLYKCGGFVPSTADEIILARQYAIPERRTIRRHGTYREEQFASVLSQNLYEAVRTQRGNARPDPFSQTDRRHWPGGYFGFPGRSADAKRLDDRYRAHWRTEYLPTPTEFIAVTLCSAVAGALRVAHGDGSRLRVTLHRAMPFGREELLQQACDYVGTRPEPGSKRAPVSAAGRTFPAGNATIGLAYRCRQIVRSRRGVSAGDLQRAMEELKLNAASRHMSSRVGFVAAIPLLEPEHPGQFYLPTPVFGVLYIDSEEPGYFLGDAELRGVVAMIQQTLDALTRLEHIPSGRIRNVPMAERGSAVPSPEPFPPDVAFVLEQVDCIAAPRTSIPFQLNHDTAEFALVRDHGADPDGKPDAHT